MICEYKISLSPDDVCGIERLQIKKKLANKEGVCNIMEWLKTKRIKIAFEDSIANSTNVKRL